MKALGVVSLALASCVTAVDRPLVEPPRKPDPVVVPTVEPAAAPRHTVRSFVDAANARDFEQVRALLAQPLRDRYTASLLERDFLAEPMAGERLKRIDAAMTGLVVSGDRAVLEWAPGKKMTLVREDSAWKIISLD